MEWNYTICVVLVGHNKWSLVSKDCGIFMNFLHSVSWNQTRQPLSCSSHLASLVQVCHKVWCGKGRKRVLDLQKTTPEGEEWQWREKLLPWVLVYVYSPPFLLLTPLLDNPIQDPSLSWIALKKKMERKSHWSEIEACILNRWVNCIKVDAFNKGGLNQIFFLS